MFKRVRWKIVRIGPRGTFKRVLRCRQGGPRRPNQRPGAPRGRPRSVLASSSERTRHPPHPCEVAHITVDQAPPSDILRVLGPVQPTPHQRPGDSGESGCNLHTPTLLHAKHRPRREIECESRSAGRDPDRQPRAGDTTGEESRDTNTYSHLSTGHRMETRWWSRADTRDGPMAVPTCHVQLTSSAKPSASRT